MFRLSILSLFFLCGTLIANAQTNALYVVAPSGLNLRAAPDASSPVLERLPFGTPVLVANDSIYAIDTLFVVRNFGYYELLVQGQEQYGKGDRPVIGQWRQITTDRSTGYLVDTYLYPNKPGTVNAEWVYYDVYSTNWGLPVNPKEYFWYGIFAEDQEVRIQSVSPDFIRTESEFSGTLIEPVYDDLAKSYGLIGSRGKLPERTLHPVYADRLDQPFAQQAPIRFTQIGGDSITYGPQEASTTYLFEAVNDSTHSRTLFQMTGGTAYPRSIRMQADLDGDGQEDYILFCFTTSDVYETVLFLGRDRINGIYQKTASCYQDFD